MFYIDSLRLHKGERVRENNNSLTLCYSLFFYLLFFNQLYPMFPYQKLDVYRRAFLLNKIIYKYLKGNPQIPSYIKNQLGKASLSIQLNIAEGCAKFSNKDRRNCFVTARGSAFECASIIEFLYSESEITEEFMKELSKEFEEISKMLFGLIKNLEEKIAK